MACDLTLCGMSLRIRLRTATLWVSESRCRPAHDGCLPDHVLAAHTLVFPRSGVFVRHRGEERDVGDPNHVVLFNPDEPYRCSHPGGGGDDCDVITIQPHALADAVRPWDPAVGERTDRIFTFGSHATEPRTALLQRLIFDRLARPGDDVAALEEAALGLVERVMEEAYRARRVRRAGPENGTTRQHAAWVEGVQRLLSSEFRRGLTLAEVSDTVGCSPFHLCRIFKRHSGFSIHRYLNRVRLRTSIDGVLDPSTNLADLADSLGYSSHSHFTDAFRREFGVTPTVVRRVAAAASARELRLILESPGTLLEAFARVAPAPNASPPPPTPVTQPPVEEPPVSPYAFRGEPLSPWPYTPPGDPVQVPLQPHAA